MSVMRRVRIGWRGLLAVGAWAWGGCVQPCRPPGDALPQGAVRVDRVEGRVEVWPPSGEWMVKVWPAGDFDGDGVGDIAVLTEVSTPLVWAMGIVRGGPNAVGGDLDELVAAGRAFPEKQMVLTAPTYDLGSILSVALGDINGDGRDDVLVPGAWEASIVLGKEFGEGDELGADILLGGGCEWCMVGWRSVPIGDLDGDGFGDVLLWALWEVDDGMYLVYGGQSGSVVLGSARAPEVIDGVDEETGEDVLTDLVGVGDVDGDGFEDVMVEMLRGTSLGGRQFLVRGGALEGLERATPQELMAAGDATVFMGWRADQWVGRRVEGLGDLNRDGYDDFLLENAMSARDMAPESLVVFGGPEIWQTRLEDLGSENSLRVEGGERLGFLGVRRGGDVDGDGRLDLLGMGSSSPWPYATAAGGVLLRGAGGFVPGQARGVDEEGQDTVVVAGPRECGYMDLRSLGDVTGDGVDDLGAVVHTQLDRSESKWSSRLLLLPGGPTWAR